MIFHRLAGEVSIGSSGDRIIWPSGFKCSSLIAFRRSLSTSQRWLALLGTIEQVAEHGDFGPDAGMESGIYVGREIGRVIGGKQVAGSLAFGVPLRVGASEAHVEGRDALLDEEGIIFGWSDGIGGDDVVFSERGFERGSQQIGEMGIVIDGVGRFVMLD